MHSTLILTCEHASNTVPNGLESVFVGAQDLLNSHRGYDLGAFSIYTKLQQLLNPAFALAGGYTRLSIELNRSLRHPALFSEQTKGLSLAIKEQLIRDIWQPFRGATYTAVQNLLLNPDRQVLHLSIHSFTPTLNNITRNCEISFLYDPKNQLEKSLALQWRSELSQIRPEWRVRFNYPYRGNADGHTTHLRRSFKTRYAGLEVELRQDWLLETGVDAVAKVLAQTWLMSKNTSTLT